MNPVVVEWVGKKATKKEFYVVVGSDVTKLIYLTMPYFKGEKCVTKIQPVIDEHGGGGQQGVHRCSPGGVRGGRPPLELKNRTPLSKNCQKFGNKTEEFIDPLPKFSRFILGPYVVKLILYVVTEIFYDPPREKFSVHTYVHDARMMELCS